jgi:hypothetical protein
MSFWRDGKRLHRSNPALFNETSDRSYDWLGWSDPVVFWPRASGKSGVAPAQHGAIPRPN